MADATGQHPATEANVTWNAEQPGAYFDGTDSQITTQGHVLETGPGCSFTVAAWVYMTNPNQNSNVLGQDSNEDGYVSGFYLGYDDQTRRFNFTRSTSNTSDAGADVAAAIRPADANTWTHLVGVYDASDDELKFYVNGVLQSETPDNTPFASNGDFAIGRCEFGYGHIYNWFPGYVRDVEVFQKALTPPEVKAL